MFGLQKSASAISLDAAFQLSLNVVSNATLCFLREYRNKLDLKWAPLVCESVMISSEFMIELMSPESALAYLTDTLALVNRNCKIPSTSVVDVTLPMLGDENSISLHKSMIKFANEQIDLGFRSYHVDSGLLFGAFKAANLIDMGDLLFVCALDAAIVSGKLLYL